VLAEHLLGATGIHAPPLTPLPPDQQVGRADSGGWEVLGDRATCLDDTTARGTHRLAHRRLDQDAERWPLFILDERQDLRALDAEQHGQHHGRILSLGTSHPWRLRPPIYHRHELLKPPQIRGA